MKGVGWFLSCQIRTVHLNHMTALTQDDQIVIVLYKNVQKTTLCKSITETLHIHSSND